MPDFLSWLEQLDDGELIQLGTQMWALKFGYGLITEEQAFDSNHLVFAYLDTYRKKKTLLEGERVKILEIINSEIERVIKMRGLT